MLLIRHRFIAVLVYCVASAGATAASPALTVAVEGVTSGKPIPELQALCIPTREGKSEKVTTPLRPTIRWSGAPKETASFAVFMMDPDVPTDFADAGKEGKMLPEKMVRMDFFHYGLVDIPANTTELAGGDGSQPPAVGHELVNDLGLNKYVNPAGAYGGPCPPWNDERLHHYHFMVLALGKDAPKDLTGTAGETDAAKKPRTAKEAFDLLITGNHVLAKGAVVGTYTLNAKLKH